jgi:hypothetical protein
MSNGYYVILDAGNMSGELWAAFGPKAGAGNISRNTTADSARNETGAPTGSSAETLDAKDVTATPS